MYLNPFRWILEGLITFSTYDCFTVIGWIFCQEFCKAFFTRAFSQTPPQPILLVFLILTSGGITILTSLGYMLFNLVDIEFFGQHMPFGGKIPISSDFFQGTFDISPIWKYVISLFLYLLYSLSSTVLDLYQRIMYSLDQKSPFQFFLYNYASFTEFCSLFAMICTIAFSFSQSCYHLFSLPYPSEPFILALLGLSFLGLLLRCILSFFGYSTAPLTVIFTLIIACCSSQIFFVVLLILYQVKIMISLSLRMEKLCVIASRCSSELRANKTIQFRCPRLSYLFYFLPVLVPVIWSFHPDDLEKLLKDLSTGNSLLTQYPGLFHPSKMSGLSSLSQPELRSKPKESSAGMMASALSAVRKVGASVSSIASGASASALSMASNAKNWIIGDSIDNFIMGFFGVSVRGMKMLIRLYICLTVFLSCSLVFGLYYIKLWEIISLTEGELQLTTACVMGLIFATLMIITGGFGSISNLLNRKTQPEPDWFTFPAIKSMLYDIWAAVKQAVVDHFLSPSTIIVNTNVSRFLTRTSWEYSKGKSGVSETVGRSLRSEMTPVITLGFLKFITHSFYSQLRNFSYIWLVALLSVCWCAPSFLKLLISSMY